MRYRGIIAAQCWRDRAIFNAIVAISATSHQQTILPTLIALQQRSAARV